MVASFLLCWLSNDVDLAKICKDGAKKLRRHVRETVNLSWLTCKEIFSGSETSEDYPGVERVIQRFR
jgi:hypothetical protein